MDKGGKLNKRIWMLFENAGFQTKPNSKDLTEKEIIVAAGKKRPLDLYAEEPKLGVIIVGSNKSGKLESSWTAHLNDCKEIKEQAKANKFLIIRTGKEVPAANKKQANDMGIVVWDEEELSYYEAIVGTIKDYGKYEIIHALGLKTQEEKDTHRVLAIRLKQPYTNSSAELFMFTISPERLLKTCFIYRKAQGDARAYQRMLRKKRLPNIRDFVNKPEAILPTDIILHLSDKVTVDEIQEYSELHDKNGKIITLSKSKCYDLVSINIPMEYASIELIDGQHRLYGFIGAEPSTISDFNLVALGIKNIDAEQRRDTFVAINDNSRRMDANLVAYLKYTEDDSLCEKDNNLMAIRIVVDLNKTSPFKKSIKLLDIGEQKLTLKGLSGYDLKGLIGSKGLLRKYFPGNKPQEYIRAIRFYFNIVRSVFKKQWDNPEKYIIATNRGVTAFLKLLKSILKTEGRFPTDITLKKYFNALNKNWPIENWELEKLKKTYVGSQGWKEFHRDILKAIKKDKNCKNLKE